MTTRPTKTMNGGNLNGGESNEEEEKRGETEKRSREEMREITNDHVKSNSLRSSAKAICKFSWVMKVKLNVMEIKIWKYCVNIAIISTVLQGAAAAVVVTV